MSKIPHDTLASPTALDPARAVAHAAVQPLTKAARANLAAIPDDSHSNLEWSIAQQMFLTHPLGPGTYGCQVGLKLMPLCLVLLRDGVTRHELALAGRSLEAAIDWIDNRLTEDGLTAASPVGLSYELPAEVSAITVFLDNDDPLLALLAAWYALSASVLSQLSEELDDLSPGPTPVRCWPHHFDIAAHGALEYSAA